MNINKLIIAGRLGKDPELRQTTNGKSVVSFTVATNRVWKDQSGAKQESTEWVNVVAWGKTAESINKYFRKGKEIYLEGRLQTRSYEKDGQKKYITEMVADTFQFVGFDKDGQQDGATDELPTIQQGGEDINVDDIPF